MKKLLVLTLAAAVLGGGVGTSADAASENLRYPDNNAWIKLWTKRDQSIYSSIKVAANIFRVSESTLRAVNGGEGGNVHPAKLRVTICNPSAYGGIGWNTQGSAAFGPFQFMLDYRGACNRQKAWGTFGSYDDAAFQEAKRQGISVPYRFKHPASNVGQALTAAYMISRGGLYVHWCASMC